MADTVLIFPTLDGRSRAKQEYLRYRADVLALLAHCPEYKIKRFWRANLSLEDLRNKKDMELWPANTVIHKKRLLGLDGWLPEQRKKYRSLSRAQIDRRLLKAMIAETDRIGRTHSLMPETRKYMLQVRAQLVERSKGIK